MLPTSLRGSRNMLPYLENEYVVKNIIVQSSNNISYSYNNFNVHLKKCVSLIVSNYFKRSLCLMNKENDVQI
jgi:hypothetical protein